MRRLGLLVLLLSLAVGAFARAGGGGGYHGGGGSFSGGSYSGGYSGGSSYYGGSSGSGDGELFAFAALVMGRHPFVTLALVLLVLWYLGRNPSETLAEPPDAPMDVSYGRGPGLDEQMEGRRAAAFEKIQANDPDFDEGKFLARAKGAFLAIQDAWSRQDMSRARPFISDGVFERFTRQIAEYKERGVRNRMSAVDVREARALGYLTGAHFDAVYVAFTATARDELVKLGTEEVVSSDDGEFTEVWTFVRRTGAKSKSHPGLLEGHCPSCGAPLPIVDAAQCAACKAWINAGEHDWVLTGITQISEWTFPDPNREVQGWRELSAADPGLSQEELDDRASVAFWRWMDARRRGDPAPLRGICSPDLLKDLPLTGRFERDVAVGGVVTAACETGGGRDRARVQVRWEADELAREPGAEPKALGRARTAHTFVFERASGLKSDPAKGLRASRCPSCGAPSEEADAAACAYCGRAFNDGSVAWVLTGIEFFGAWGGRG